MTKAFWQSKTLWLNALILAAFVLDTITHTITLTPDQLGWLTVAVAGVNMALRLVTNTGLTLTPPPTQPIAPQPLVG